MNAEFGDDYLVWLQWESWWWLRCSCAHTTTTLAATYSGSGTAGKAGKSWPRIAMFPPDGVLFRGRRGLGLWLGLGLGQDLVCGMWYVVCSTY